MTRGREINVVSFSVLIEKDDGAQGKFKVVIRKGKELIGTPLRGVEKSKAEELKPHLIFAFKYGLESGRDECLQAIHDCWIEVK